MRRILVLLLVTVVTLSGCIAVSVDGRSDRGIGPPPHAPAHGYRHKHQGTTLAFDSKIGVYVVVGHADLFYSDGRFLRLDAGSWQVSASLSGPWKAYSLASVPPGLRKAHPVKVKRHGKHEQQFPAKMRW
jgi:hypothetical protein